MLRKFDRFAPPLVVILVFSFPQSSAIADPVNGERLARLWCASCHVVAPNQTGASADVPTFEAIGRMPGFDRTKIAFFLLDPHPKMPNMSLSRIEASDLADYITRLGASR
jgi:mono/diheme cytochrome c family protein